MTLVGFIVIGLGLTLQRMTATGGLPIALMSAGNSVGGRRPKCAQRPRPPIRLVAVLPSLNVLGAHAHHHPPIGQPAPQSGSGFSPPPPVSYRRAKLPRATAGFGRSCLRRGADLPQVPAL